VGGLIDRLEESRWIERKADPSDRRMNRVYLTAKAHDIDEEMTKTGYKLIDQTLRNLSADERETLINLLIEVKRNLLEDLPIETEDA
jgi:DNA-binding MarR family transcriptional regulator